VIRRLIAVWQVLGGLTGLLISAVGYIPVVFELPATHAALIGLAQVYFLGCVLAGVFLWRDTRLALVASAGAMLPQVLQVACPRLTYSMFLFLAAGPYLGSQGIGVGFNLGLVEWRLALGGNPDTPWHLGLNLVPMAALVFLRRESARRAWRRGAAARIFE